MAIDTGGRGKSEPIPPFSENLIRRAFYWRLNTEKASQALITLRFFECGTVVSARSVSSSHYTFSSDFIRSFSLLCEEYELNPETTACYEEYFVKDLRLGFYTRKYIEFRLLGGLEGFVYREVISEKDFFLLINRMRYG